MRLSGTTEGPLFFEADATVEGEPGAVVDAQGRAPAVHVAAHGLTVTVRGVTLTNGYGETGSGALLEGYSTLVLDGCAFRDNREGQGGGRGLTARRGTLVARSCTFGPREDVIVTNTATATFEGCDIGDLAVLDGATVTLKGGRVRRLELRGTTSRVPTVTIDGTEIGELANDPILTARIVRS
jgi:hypothetical protein